MYAMVDKCARVESRSSKLERGCCYIFESKHWRALQVENLLAHLWLK